MVTPRVLVGCPTFEGYEYCLQEYAERVKNLSYPSYDILIADNSKGDQYLHKIKQLGLGVIKAPYLEDVRERIIHSRNMLRDYLLQQDYEYFLSLEQDVIPPLDVIEKLMQHQQPVVSGVYYKEFHVTYTHKGKPVKTTTKIMPLICTLLPGAESTEKVHLCTSQEVEGNKFFRIRGAGLGCILIHRKIIEQLPFRTSTDTDQKGTFDDLNFSNDLYKLGIPMYADTSVKCRHLLSQKKHAFD